MTDWEILVGFKKYLLEAINESLQALDSKYYECVNDLEPDAIQIGQVDDPSSMAYPTMLYILPDTSEIIESSSESDIFEYSLQIAIQCKGDEKKRLIMKSHIFYEIIYQIIKAEPVIGGLVDSCSYKGQSFFENAWGSKDACTAVLVDLSFIIQK